jgi:hypothetical protein
MKYLIQTTASGEMKPEASFQILGDAVEYYYRCCFLPDDNVLVELVNTETGEVLDVSSLNDNYIDSVSDADLAA